MDPFTSSKAYWSVLKSFVNNQKVPCIFTIFQENRFATSFKEKGEILTSSFTKKC